MSGKRTAFNMKDVENLSENELYTTGQLSRKLGRSDAYWWHAWKKNGLRRDAMRGRYGAMLFRGKDVVDFVLNYTGVVEAPVKTLPTKAAATKSEPRFDVVDRRSCIIIVKTPDSIHIQTPDGETQSHAARANAACAALQAVMSWE